MDDVAVLLEHVDLLDALDGLDVHLLEGGLQLLVIGAGVAGNLLDLAARGTLASVEKSVVVRRGQEIGDNRSESWCGSFHSHGRVELAGTSVMVENTIRPPHNIEAGMRMWDAP